MGRVGGAETVLLLVDDEPALLELARRFIERDGRYAVEVATSGEEALRLLGAREFVAIISDYEMPGITGLDLLRHLRTSGDATPFIVFTGRGREEVAMEVLDSGASYYLQKDGDARTQFGELLYLVDRAVRTADAERLVRTSTEAYQAIFEHTGAASLILEEDARVARANLAFEELSGCRREDLIGSIGVLDLVAEEDRERLLGYHHSRRAEPGQAPERYEFRFRGPDGGLRLAAASVGMIPGTKRSIASFIEVSGRDAAPGSGDPSTGAGEGADTLPEIVYTTFGEGESGGSDPARSIAPGAAGEGAGTRPTAGTAIEHLQNEQALLRANEKLNLLSSITRHDIQNQLTLLAGYLDLAQEDCYEPVVRSYLAGIRQATTTIRRQIAFTKIYQDIGIRSAQWHRLDDVVTQAAECAAPDRLLIESTVGDVEIRADPLFSRVVENIIENTVRHGGDATRLRFSCESHGDGLVIRIEDDGVGVRAEEKEWIFERGYGQNTGFGLFLAREILGITGIGIEETGTPGEGASFRISVPAGQFRFPVPRREAPPDLVRDENERGTGLKQHQ